MTGNNPWKLWIDAGVLLEGTLFHRLATVATLARAWVNHLATFTSIQFRNLSLIIRTTTMRKTRHLICSIALAAAAVATLALPARSATENEGALIAILQSDSPKKDKAITCKKLAVFGSARAVPALATLLPDKELTSWARIALEVIPGPAADQALRDAMGKVHGRTLIGVINSIGVRRDAKAVDGLAQKLRSDNAHVAAAAALALGLVLNEWNLLTLIVVLAGIIGLSIIKQLILPALLDLI